MKLSLIFIGSTGAGPAYSFEMARALALSRRCEMQIIVSSRALNIKQWIDTFSEMPNVSLVCFDTFKKSSLHALLSMINFRKQNKLINLIKSYGPDVVYSPFVTIWGNYVFGRLSKFTRVINTLHDPEPHYPPKNNAELIIYIVNLANRFVNDIVLLNKKDKDKVEKKYGKKTIVIPHASLSYGDRKDIHLSGPLTRTIGFMGRIEPYKGVELLVEAFEKCSTAGLKLLIAGSGKIGDKLRTQILNNPNIELINRYIRDEEIPEIIKKMDFMVLPYKNATQSGVIPMSFSMGKPVIATNVGALEEQVVEGTGWLVEVNAHSIKDKIEWLYCNPDAIFNAGKKAYKYSQDYLTWESSARLLLDYLEQG